MQALVTGANGFVGSHLCRALCDAGAEVKGFYVTDPAPSWEYLNCACDVELIKCDISKKDQVARAFAKVAPDVIFHLAAVSFNPFCNAHPDICFDINTFGTRNLLEYVLNSMPDARFLFISTCEVYGRAVTAEKPVDESAEPQPVNAYPLSKRTAEKIVLDFARMGIDAVIARPFNHTGIGQSVDFVTHAFAAQVAKAAAAAAGKRVVKVGNLDAVRDFSDVRDIVDAYLLLAEKGGKAEIYNIASGKGRRIGDILARLIEMSGVEIEVKPDFARMRPSDIPVFVGDSGKIRALGWKPVRDFNDTLKEIFEYYRAGI